MPRAVAPKEFPPLPEGAVRWRRSLREGSMYHAVGSLGYSVCKSITLDRNRSQDTDNLGDMQYWGCCPRCYAKAIDSAVLPPPIIEHWDAYLDQIGALVADMRFLALAAKEAEQRKALLKSADRLALRVNDCRLLAPKGEGQ